MPKDKARAARLDTQACDLDGRECLGLALKYKLGEGVPKDVARAAALYKRACEAGSVLGCEGAGQLHAAGDGVPRDLGGAAALFKQGCDGRDPSACDHLGRLYVTGGGVPKDLGRAAALFKQACEGVGAAFVGCYDLGRLYATGEGVPKDLGRAAALFKQACDGGYPFACNALKSISGQGNRGAAPPAGDKRTTEALAERVRQAYTCPAVVKSAREQSESGMTTWTLECSDGHAYTILVGRTGETTVIQKPK